MNHAKRVEFLLSIGEEITTQKELVNLLNAMDSPLCYDGFEPSGRMHIAQGLLKTLFVRKMTEAGCVVLLWIADWFAKLNNKMDGDLEKIRTVGKYMIEIWRACGMPVDKVNFVWASEEINKYPDKYWALVMDICSTFTITRLKRCTKILGRKCAEDDVDTLVSQARNIVKEMNAKSEETSAIGEEKDGIEEKNYDSSNTSDTTTETTNTDFDGQTEVEKLQAKIKNLETEVVNLKSKLKEASEYYEQALTAIQNENMPTSYLLYAAMQCADIYYLGADICQLGMDQRKVNILAREYHDHLFNNKSKQKLLKFRLKPIIVSHHMLMGLKEGQEKMSKSDPESAIFMEDTVEDVNRKIKRAFCRPKEIEGNPVIDYYKHIIFPYLEIDNNALTIDKKEWGGVKTYSKYSDFEKDYLAGDLHPADIKPKLSSEINKLLEPVRNHFTTNKEAKDLFEKVKKFKITK